MLERQKPKITHMEANEFYRSVIETWEPESEVWPYVYGDEVLVGLSGCTSVYVTHFFRRFLKLRYFGTVTTHLPIAGMSCIMTHFMHTNILNSSLLSRPECSLCLPTKAALSQITSGFFYPMLFSGVVCFWYADKMLTYPIPPIARAPREALNLYLKIVQKYRRPLMAQAAIHLMAAAYVTYEKRHIVDKFMREK